MKTTNPIKATMTLLVLLFLASFAEVCSYKLCSQKTDCAYPGCADVPCSTSSPNCKNGKWKYDCYKLADPFSPACFFGERFPTPCPDRNSTNATDNVWYLDKWAPLPTPSGSVYEPGPLRCRSNAYTADVKLCAKGTHYCVTSVKVWTRAFL